MTASALFAFMAAGTAAVLAAVTVAATIGRPDLAHMNRARRALVALGLIVERSR